MLNRLSVYKLSLLALFTFLVGCEETGTTETAPVPDTFEPAPIPDQIFDAVNQVFIGFVRDEVEGESATQAFDDRGGQLSILSFDPAEAINRDSNSGDLNPQSLRTADTGLVEILDTDQGAVLEPEFTVYVEQDSLFVLNHQNNEVRFLSQFTNTVCEILPYKEVSVSGDPGSNQTLSLLDARTVYVRTTSASSCFGDISRDENQTQRYFRVALNFKVDAAENELCVENGGTNTNSATCFSDDFTPVLESEARSEIVFSWVDDDETADPNDHKPSWGYLGYGVTERALVYFNSDRQQVWSQTRNIVTTIPVDEGQAVDFSPTTIAKLTPLDNDSGDLANPVGFSYVLQLGRDLFVFDGNNDLADVPVSDLDTLLSDRTYKLDQQIDQSLLREVLSEAVFVFDEDEILFVDGFRVHRFNYATPRFSPVVTREFTINMGDNVYNPLSPRDLEPFTQFDLESCENSAIVTSEIEGQPDTVNQAQLDACNNAHDVEDTLLPAPGPAWAFIADCTAILGCSLPVNATDVCVSDAELALDPSLADQNNPCLVSEYEHLDELDMPGNSAEFRGYMQYENQIRDIDLALSGDRLYITARMLERDLLIQYDYDQSLNALRSLREQVLLGSQFEYQGMNVRFENGDMYADVLRQSAVRNNECYKGYQQVACDLGNTLNSGGVSACSGVDLAARECVTEFKEYKTYALFCSAQDFIDGTCLDDGVCPLTGSCNVIEAPLTNILAPGAADMQTKWYPLRQQTTAGVDTRFLLLLSDDDQDDPASDTDSFVKDEGVLGRPNLFSFDATAPASIAPNPITTLDVEIESVSDFVSSANGNHLSIISSEVIQVGGGVQNSSVSELSQHVILDLNSVNQETEPAASLQFRRPITDPDGT